MKQSSHLFSASLAVYLLVFPLVFFGLHSHPPHSIVITEFTFSTNDLACLDQQFSDCSLCDQYYSQNGIVESVIISFFRVYYQNYLAGSPLVEPFRLFIESGLRGPPAYFLQVITTACTYKL